jgi:hypothetical protein
MRMRFRFRGRACYCASCLVGCLARPSCRACHCRVTSDFAIPQRANAQLSANSGGRRLAYCMEEGDHDDHLRVRLRRQSGAVCLLCCMRSPRSPLPRATCTCTPEKPRRCARATGGRFGMHRPARMDICPIRRRIVVGPALGSCDGAWRYPAGLTHLRASWSRHQSYPQAPQAPQPLICLQRIVYSYRP